MEKPPSFSPEDIPEFQKQRILSDAEIIKGGGEVTPDGKVHPTESQVEDAHREMELEKEKDSAERQTLVQEIHTKEDEIKQTNVDIEKVGQMIDDAKKELAPLEEELAHIEEGREYYEIQKKLEECSGWLTNKDGEFDRMISVAENIAQLSERDLKNAPKKFFGRTDKDLESKLASTLEEAKTAVANIRSLKDRLMRAKGIVNQETAEQVASLAEAYPQQFSLYKYFKEQRDKSRELDHKLIVDVGSFWQNRNQNTGYSLNNIEDSKKKLDTELSPKRMHLKELESFLTFKRQSLSQAEEELREKRGRLSAIEKSTG